VANISGSVDLSQISDQQFDPQLELRVAVVRDGTVLGSATLAPTQARQQLSFAVAFEPPVRAPARLPCPVVLLIGPNVGDAELQSLETLRVEVDLRPEKATRAHNARAVAKAEAARDVDVGKLELPAALYAGWLIVCRTYTIHGRVVCRRWQYDPQTGRWVFCDAPVPGARVEVYDVDCFLWWCWRSLIASGTTDISGNFTITFRRCCLLWRPWPPRNWTVDPDLYGRIYALLGAAGITVPPLPPGPDPLFLQELAANAALSPNAARGVSAPGIVDMPASAETLRGVLPQSAELARLRVWPWYDWDDCDPDVVFRVTQVCHDETRVIYSESNANVRVDIPTTLNVTLLANDQACCLPACQDPECPECLDVTWVGCTPWPQISADAGPPDLRGFAYAAATLDRPFYNTMQIRGGVGWDVDYFKLQYAFNGGPWTDLATPMFEGYTRSWYDASLNPHSVSFAPVTKSGQTVIMTRRHFEDLNPGIPRFGGAVIWDDYDTLFLFDTFDYSLKTALLPDGLYQLRFVGFSADAADNLILASERILPACGKETPQPVYIRLDNQSLAPHIVPGIPCTPIHACIAEPDCYIRRICVNEGKVGEHCISACDIAVLSATDTLTIHFTASCPTTTQDGHLAGYWLRAEYGASKVFYIGTGIGTFQPDPTFEVGPDYASALLQGAPRPQWYGGDYKVTLTGADFPECCAYLLHLRAWKRTTNGCSDPQSVHANEFELSFTVLRPELCPDVCKGQQQLA
jgi:hypothetical protein